MAAPPEPRILAKASGVVVAERGPLVIVVDRGTGVWATLAFVLAVLALVPAGFGAITLSTRPRGTRVIARGNPFQGGLGDLETALAAAVFGARR